jgi:polyhydroxybutyrate depolymerase
MDFWGTKTPKMKSCIFINTFLLFLFGCKISGGDEPVNPNFEYGKNRFTINVDGFEREYYVHVPKAYKPDSPSPVVFMLHGTSGDGEKFYNNSGWKEVGEAENFLTVFPSSARYCISDGDGISNTTKWNVVPDAEFKFCSGQTPRNDIKFLRNTIEALKAKFSVDSKRIYLSGFSNGSQMAAKCTIEMSDVLAAVCENAGTFYLDTTYTPKRKLPIWYQIGNEDYGPGNTGPSIPLASFNELLKTNEALPNYLARFKKSALRHIKYFSLNSNFTMSGDTSKVMLATYKPLVGNDYEFRYTLVKNMAHVYPNGDNHWLEGAKTQWAWFKQYRLP